MSAGADDLEISEVDPWDDEAFDAFHAVHAAAHRHGREATASVWTRPEMRATLREPTERRWRRIYAARRGGEIVGAATMEASLVDNLDNIEVEVGVRPDVRRQGIGSALLAHLETVAAGRGSTVLQAQVAWPYDADPLGAGHPDVEWALTRGFALGLVDIQRRLALPVDDAVLDDLADAAAPHHAAYEVRAWSGRIPDDLVDGWAALESTLMTEAPTGEMDREDEVADAAAVREGEALVAKQGRRKYNAVALDPAGVVVAYTDIATTVHEPGLAYQWGTLVHRDHRGHRLGTAVKVANLRLLQAERPDIATVRTWNAEVNAHMVSVNEALGFRPAERGGELQKRL